MLNPLIIHDKAGIVPTQSEGTTHKKDTTKT